MNRKGFELTVGMLVLLALGVVLLIGLIYVLTQGFSGFSRSTSPYLESSEAAAVRGACRLSCESRDTLGYCCRTYPLGNMDVSCADERLEIDCALSCQNVSCTERPLN